MIGDEERHAYDQPEVHDIYRRWRAVLDSYPGDRMATGEVWVRDAAALARYVRPDELHLAFNFRYLSAPWDAGRYGPRSTPSSRCCPPGPRRPGCCPITMSYAIGPGSAAWTAPGRPPCSCWPFPASAYLYNGEELGLPEADVPAAAIQDPQWFRSGGTQPTRDGARVPLPWSGDRPPYGFSPDGRATVAAAAG